MDKPDFMRFGFKMSFGWLSYISSPLACYVLHHWPRIASTGKVVIMPAFKSLTVPKVFVTPTVCAPLRTKLAPLQLFGFSITWWLHQMEIFSALFVTGEFPSQRPVTRSFKMFSLICAWTIGWVHNRDAADLRRHRSHYDVTAMT